MGIDFIVTINSIPVGIDINDPQKATKEDVALKVVEQLVRMRVIEPVVCRDDEGKQIFVIK